MSVNRLILLAVAAGLPCLVQQANAQNSSSVHEGNWPIEGGVKHQPTRGELGGGEFSRSQQEETDKLYDELMSNYSATHHTGNARMR